MRWVVFSAFTLTVTACVAPGALHVGMHPSMHGNTHAAGVNVGLAYATTVESEFSSTSGFQLPYGEGFARFATGAGQVEVRMTPGGGYLAFRFDVLSAEETSVGLALRPSVGVGYLEYGSDRKASQLSLVPNAALIISFAGGAAYVAPRIGFSHVETTSGGADSESTGFLAVGGNIGFIIDAGPWDVVLEMGIQRVASTEENAGGAVLVVAPTVGIQL